MVEYRHGLSRGLVQALATAWQSFDIRPFDATKIGLPRVQYLNFQKLRYWGFIEHSRINVDRGGWIISRAGRDFLFGETDARKFAVTYRGQTVRLDGPIVMAHEILPGYQKRSDYAVAARAPENPQQQKLNI